MLTYYITKWCLIGHGLLWLSELSRRVKELVGQPVVGSNRGLDVYILIQ